MRSRLASHLLAIALGVACGGAMAWSNHSLVAYRTFERMAEVANAAPVLVEPLEQFLRSEEKTIEALLASQEAWAVAHLPNFPVRPEKLAFQADASRTDETRRRAFLMALRVAPNARFALYVQPDPRQGASLQEMLPFAAVNTLPEPERTAYRFAALRAGDSVAALSVLASACDEPDYGLDINLWEDSPSEWGKLYGFSTLPFGNPALPYATQAPFHMAFLHESKVLYLAAPFLKRTYPLLRLQQYSTLAALAFRTDHAYWGWRFAGLALHYLQDLTQPYHARLAPGESTARLLGINALAMIGLGSMKEELVVLLSNRHLVLEKYQAETLSANALRRQDTPLERTLHSSEQDARYPAWTDRYAQDVAAEQAAATAARLAQTIVESFPAEFVSDPGYDFGTHEDALVLVDEMTRRGKKDTAQLDAALAELLGNLGAHSRNALRAILKAGSP